MKMKLAIPIVMAVVVLGSCVDRDEQPSGRTLFVVATDPYNGETHVFWDDWIEITFSNPVDPWSVLNKSTVGLFEWDGTEVETTVWVDGSRVYLLPASRLEIMMTYRVVVSDSVRDVQGNFMIGAEEFFFDTGFFDVGPD